MRWLRLPTLRKTSGQDCIKILCKHFGFQVVRQKGSHVVLRKETPTGSVGTVVPDHRELKVGTLKGVLKLAKVPEDAFAAHQ